MAVQERIISTEIDLKHQMPKDEVNQYITEITETGIQIHPKLWAADSHYLQLNGEGAFIKESTGIELSKFTGNNIQIGKDEDWKVDINTGGINIIDGTSGTDIIKASYGEGASFYDDEAERTAYIGSNLITIGKDNNQHVDIGANATVYYNTQQRPIAEISQGLYGEITTTVAPESLELKDKYILTEDTEVVEGKDYYIKQKQTDSYNFLADYNSYSLTYTIPEKLSVSSTYQYFTIVLTIGSTATSSDFTDSPDSNIQCIFNSGQLLTKGEYLLTLKTSTFNDEYEEYIEERMLTVNIRDINNNYSSFHVELHSNDDFSLPIILEEDGYIVNFSYDVLYKYKDTPFRIDNIKPANLTFTGLYQEKEIYTKVTSPSGNPKELGYYELKDIVFKLTNPPLSETPLNFNLFIQTEDDPEEIIVIDKLKAIEDDSYTDELFNIRYNNQTAYLSLVENVKTVERIDQMTLGSMNDWTLDFTPIKSSQITVYTNSTNKITFTQGISETKQITANLSVYYDGDLDFLIDGEDSLSGSIYFNYYYLSPLILRANVEYKATMNLPFYTFGMRLKQGEDLYLDYSDEDYNPGAYSLAIGNKVNAHGNYSTAFGEGTLALTSSSVAIGQYNDPAIIERSHTIHERCNIVNLTGELSHATEVDYVDSISIIMTVGETEHVTLGWYTSIDDTKDPDEYFEIDEYNPKIIRIKTNHLPTSEGTFTGITIDYTTDVFVGPLFSVGNGISSNRSNAFMIDGDGNIFTPGRAGFIQMYAGDEDSDPPIGWLFCNGDILLREDYPLLYSVIGKTYNIGGEERNQFRLPDLRGRVPVGTGKGSGLTERSSGNKFGAETHTLEPEEMPRHRHDMGNAWSSGSGSSTAYTQSSNRTLTTRYTGYAGGKSDNTTSPHNNMQPSLAINFIICTGEY